MTLVDKRRAIRLLLDEQNPVDAIAAYYAFYHSEAKSEIVTYPVDAGPGQAVGYVALSRTGMDLFRPFVTLRLPIADMSASVELIHTVMTPGTAVILRNPISYLPLLQALFDVHTEEQLQLYVLERNRFEPVINVLVAQTTAPNNLPRFAVRRSAHDNEVVASAGLNWQSPHFAEISVNTNVQHRRRGWGRSVLAAMAQHLLGNGRTPLYVVNEQNEASIQLAQSIGFVSTGTRTVLLQGTLKPHP